MRKLICTAAFALALLANAQMAHAYIGPGLGAGVIAVILGILSSVFLALGAVIYYPFKRFMKRRRAARTALSADSEQR